MPFPNTINQRKRAVLSETRRYRFRSARKLKKENEISFIARCGIRCSCPSFSIIYFENRQKRSRCAVLVPQKAGSSVVRNTIKRRFREFLRCFLERNNLRVDVIVKVHPRQTDEIWYESIEKEFNRWFA